MRSWLILRAPLVLAWLPVAVACEKGAPPPVGWEEAVMADYVAHGAPVALSIDYPLNETLFPPDIAAPTIAWHDESGRADRWLIRATRPSGPPLITEVVRERFFRPTQEQWLRVQAGTPDEPVRVVVLGLESGGRPGLVSGGAVSIATSADPVLAPVFFRQVPLPFDLANHHPDRIRYSLGNVEGGQPPKVLLEGLPVCGNCHSFDHSGKTLGMDVDYANDKGSYVIASIEPTTMLTPEKIITWSDYRRRDGDLTFGLLSQISPDARYVVSTVKDRSIFVGLPDRLEYSQLFFPIRGILAYYDRAREEFQALPGADEPALVQSNPNWTPDGKQILFTRAVAYRSARAEASKGAILPAAAASEFLEGKRGFQYDIYTIPFNDGRGGAAEPVRGASRNGMSNYFPRMSPDGKWLVYTQSKNFMLLQPDSKLVIVPAAGGVPRVMRCNTPNMNSWHSWSPNGRWLVFSSKARGPYTQLLLTHVDEHGQDTPAVVLENLTSNDRAANIPEFVAIAPGGFQMLVDGFSAGDNYPYRVAKTLIHYDDLKAAEVRLDRAVVLQPKDPDVWLERGAVLFRLGKTEQSFSDFRTAIALDPKDYRGPYDLGVSQLEIARVDDAVESLSLALRLHDQSPALFYHRARAYVKQRKTALALADARRAVALDAKAKATLKFAAELAQRLGDHRAAVADLDSAIALDPDFGAAWLDRSYSKLSLKDYSGAEQDWRKGSQLAPRDPLVGIVEAGLAFARGDAADGCQILRRARATAGVYGAEVDRVLAMKCP